MGRARILISCLTLLLALAGTTAAQTRSEGPYRPQAGVFDRLFRQCAGCGGAPGAVHMVLGSPLLTDLWLLRHGAQSNGGSLGDNAIVADFWYDAVHRRLFTRSLVLQEVDDPADLRLGRAAGTFPDRLDFRGELQPGTTVGHVGFVPWTTNGFGAYFAAVQGAVRDRATGYLDLATVTGETGVTRSGSRYDPQDLIKHVRLHPSGQLEVGFDTDPVARPDVSLLVRGNVEVEGTLTVGRVPFGEPQPDPVMACSVQSVTGAARSVAASCGPGQLATGGGGTCAGGEMRGSRPIVQGYAPVGWELTCDRDGAHAVYVVCCTR